MEAMVARWPVDDKCVNLHFVSYVRFVTTIARRPIDLAVVSVLLDAGAGHEWAYMDNDGCVCSSLLSLAST